MASIAMTSSFSLVAISILALLLCNVKATVETQGSECDAMSFIDEDIGNCRRLRTLGAELGWRYNMSVPNVTVDIVFGAKPEEEGGWIAWGLNPGKRPQMVGTRALIAFMGANGTVEVLTYNVTADAKHGCKLRPSAIEIKVENARANYSAKTGAITMSARLSLDPSSYNITNLKHVWQVGSCVIDRVPLMHALRLKSFDSFEKIDLTSARGFMHRGLTMQRYAHGILSVIGWGILLPMGVIFKRYSKVCESEGSCGSAAVIKRQRMWFMVHVAFQMSAYTVGATAWGIGIALMSNSRHFKTFKGHRNIGIIIFCLATLQMTALCLKPVTKEKDKGKFDSRRKWNVYHHLVGYTLIILAIVNILKGFAILQPPYAWKWIYVAVLATLACVALGLEIASWAADRSGRTADGVRVVAVGKTKPTTLIRSLYDAGHRCFGENYAQELVDKAPQLPSDIGWHFIGHLQSNKVKSLLAAVPNLDMIESVDSEKIASHLNRAVASLGRNPLKVLVQVNTSGEESKSGVEPARCLELAKHVKFSCPNLIFSGLMTIGMPDYTSTPENFRALWNCRADVCSALVVPEKQYELSMGMSGDFEKAIEMGSTNVRIGSTIFGPREYPKKNQPID
ncbi:hypothetical protein Cni_G11694 [Canna indica]|uniref:Pyridoxal phosphate homeostasis protein n=1 Tax=Canna indica TaxID=4628 RepID=A0AAQ3K883_9LILI|nr:hypothetical protein Cni_G11694 [Canna indica]